MAEIDYSFLFTLPPEKIVEYFTRKGMEISYNWQDVWKEQHHQAFTVAKAMNMDVLQTLRDSVEKSIKEGITYADFKKGLQGNLTNLGWWGKQEIISPETGLPKKVQLGSPNRLRIIYETNLNVAYAVGHYNAMKDNSGERPYWRYRAIMDSNTRDTHAQLHNKVYIYNHPFWDKYYPPNGWGCRCTVDALTEAEAIEFGYTKNRGIPNVSIPEEWNYNPAKTPFTPDPKNYDRDIFDQFNKVKKIIPPPETSLASKLAEGWPDEAGIIADNLRHLFGNDESKYTVEKFEQAFKFNKFTKSENANGIKVNQDGFSIKPNYRYFANSLTPDNAKIIGDIIYTDLQGKSKGIGTIERTIARENGKLTVTNSLFTIAQPYQGGGLAKGLFSNTIPFYDSLGVQNIKVHAGLDGGKATWGKFGFDFDPEYKENNNNFKKSFKNIAKDNLRNGLMGKSIPLDKQNSITKEYLAKLSALRTPQDFITFEHEIKLNSGKVITITGEDIIRNNNWNMDWFGIMDMDKGSRDRQILADYLKGKK